MSAVPNEAAKVIGWMRKLGQRHSHKLPGQVGHAGNHANTAVHRSLQNNNSSRLFKISGLKTEWSTAPVLLADCVTTGNWLKNGVHCGL